MKRSENGMRETGIDRLFDVMNTFLLLAVLIIILYPLYFTVIASFSNAEDLLRGKVMLYPVNFTVEAYINIFKNDSIWTGYLNTFFYTSVGTVYALAVTLPTAYAVSRNIRGQNWFMFFFMFTMYFSGGLIPSYLLIRQLNLINTRWSLIIPYGISIYNMLITRTYFKTLPEELFEAAKIDGANEYRTFFQIALPLSGAIIAVIALYTAVGHWNSYFGAMIYLIDEDKFPLQLVLRNILLFNQQMRIESLSSMSALEMESIRKRTLMAETMKYALIFISSLPVLIAYPFVQKFFVKGVMIGAIKG